MSPEKSVEGRDAQESQRGEQRRQLHGTRSEERRSEHRGQQRRREVHQQLELDQVERRRDVEHYPGGVDDRWDESEDECRQRNNPDPPGGWRSRSYVESLQWSSLSLSISRLQQEFDAVQNLPHPLA